MNTAFDETNLRLRDKAVARVLAEREKQVSKWGIQRHSLPIYLAILMEEVGELSEVSLHDIFGGKEAGRALEEATHTAAVALSIVEMLEEENEKALALS